MWFVRMMEIEDREEVDRFWETQEDREEQNIVNIVDKE